MDVSVKCDASLGVSVSFGRFENDALSWEKWSSFSPNKYLEEVGTLSTPGSVAQKKAYFEAHYKKIAAQKTDVLEQEKPHFEIPDFSSKGTFANSANVEKLVMEEPCLSVPPYGCNGKQTDDDKALMDAIISDEERVHYVIAVNGGCPGIEEAKGNLDHAESNDPGMDAVDSHQNVSEDIPEKNSGNKGILEKPCANRMKKSSLNSTGAVVQKVTTKKETTATMRKVVSPATNQLHSKPVSTTASAPLPLKKKVNGTPLPKSKSSLSGDSKRIAPKSLHMSLNSGLANSFDSPSTTSKSMIMEKMGDKDIVRRAFKTFQKRDGASPPAEKANTIKHESSSPAVKGNERLKKDSDKRTSATTRSNPLPGSHKMPTLDKKYSAGFSPSALTNCGRAEKPKELREKMGTTSNGRVTETAPPQ